MFAKPNEIGSVESLTTEIENVAGSLRLNVALPFEARRYEFSLPAGEESLDASNEDEVPVLRRVIDTHAGEVIRTTSLPTVIKEVCIARFGGVRSGSEWFSARATIAASNESEETAPNGHPEPEIWETANETDRRLMTDGGEPEPVTDGGSNVLELDEAQIVPLRKVGDGTDAEEEVRRIQRNVVKPSIDAYEELDNGRHLIDDAEFERQQIERLVAGLEERIERANAAEMNRLRYIINELESYEPESGSSSGSDAGPTDASRSSGEDEESASGGGSGATSRWDDLDVDDEVPDADEFGEFVSWADVDEFDAGDEVIFTFKKWDYTNPLFSGVVEEAGRDSMSNAPYMRVEAERGIEQLPAGNANTSGSAGVSYEEQSPEVVDFEEPAHFALSQRAAMRRFDDGRSNVAHSERGKVRLYRPDDAGDGEAETDGGEELVADGGEELVADGGEERLPRFCPNDDEPLEPRDDEPLEVVCPECGYHGIRNLRGERIKVCHKKARIGSVNRSGEAFEAEVEIGGVVQHIVLARQYVRERIDGEEEPEVMTDGGEVPECPDCRADLVLNAGEYECLVCCEVIPEDEVVYPSTPEDAADDIREARSDGGRLMTDGGHRRVPESGEAGTLTVVEEASGEYVELSGEVDHASRCESRVYDGEDDETGFMAEGVAGYLDVDGRRVSFNTASDRVTEHHPEAEEAEDAVEFIGALVEAEFENDGELMTDGGSRVHPDDEGVGILDSENDDDSDIIDGGDDGIIMTDGGVKNRYLMVSVLDDPAALYILSDVEDGNVPMAKVGGKYSRGHSTAYSEHPYPRFEMYSRIGYYLVIGMDVTASEFSDIVARCMELNEDELVAFGKDMALKPPNSDSGNEPEVMTDGGRPVREEEEFRTLMGEYNPEEWNPEPDPDYYRSGEVSIHDPIEGEAYSEPGHWANRPPDMDAAHARRLALRGEFDNLDEHQPLPLLSSDMQGVPTEGVQGSYSEVTELDEPCSECSQCWGIHSVVTMAGVHQVKCLICEHTIEQG